MADLAIESGSKCTNVHRWRTFLVQMPIWNKTCTSIHFFNLIWLIKQSHLGQNAQMIFDGGLYWFKCVIRTKLAHLYTLST